MRIMLAFLRKKKKRETFIAFSRLSHCLSHLDILPFSVSSNVVCSGRSQDDPETRRSMGPVQPQHHQVAGAAVRFPPLLPVPAFQAFSFLTHFMPRFACISWSAMNTSAPVFPTHPTPSQPCAE